MELNEWHQAIGVELHDIKFAITIKGWDYYDRAPIGRHYDDLEREAFHISGDELVKLFTYLDIPFVSSRMPLHNNKRKYIREEKFVISYQYENFTDHISGDLISLQCKILAPQLINIRFQVGWFWDREDREGKESPYDSYTIETMTYNGLFSVFWKERQEENCTDITPNEDKNS